VVVHGAIVARIPAKPLRHLTPALTSNAGRSFTKRNRPRRATRPYAWTAMRIDGTQELPLSRTEVWSGLHDARVLANALPGLRRLEERGHGGYDVTIEFGVGAIRGVYSGRFTLEDAEEHERCRLETEASGPAGSVGAVAEIRLEQPAPGATRISYAADVTIGGTIGGVGQRLIAATAQRTAERFFDGLERELTAPAAASPPGGEPAVAGRFEKARPEPAARPARGFLGGFALGFAAAIAGVLVGRWTAGRR
jgi:carbon monoxide dehydrogenase subunit G